MNRRNSRRRTKAQRRAEKRRRQQAESQAKTQAKAAKAEEKRTPRRGKRSHRIYAVLIIVLGLVIIIGTVLLLFYVQTIVVDGNEYCSDEEIADDVLDDDFSVNSLYVVAKYALGRGKVPPLVEEMDVSLSNPWTVKVTVKEKQAVGYVSYGDEYLCFDKEGTVIREVTEPPANLPLVEGIKVEHAELFEELTSENTEVFSEILEVTKELQKNELSCDKIICMEDNIYLYIGKVCISLGDKISEEQVDQIGPILTELGNREGTLHMEGYGTSNGTITFDMGEYPQ